MREVLRTRRHGFCGVVLVKPTTLQLQLEMLKQYCPPIHIGLLYIFILQCKVSDFLFWLIAWHKKHTRSKIISSVMNGQYFRLCSKNRTGVFKAWDCGPPQGPSLGKGVPTLQISGCPWDQYYVIWSNPRSTTEPRQPNNAVWHNFRLRQIPKSISFCFCGSWKNSKIPPNYCVINQITHI